MPASNEHPNWSTIGGGQKALIITLIVFMAGVVLGAFFCHFIRNRRTTTAAAAANSDSAAISTEVIASLPTFIYSSAELQEKKKVECPVCLMEFEDGEIGRSLPRCLHRFHAECVDIWLAAHNSCPLCRSTVDEAQLQQPPAPV